MPLNTTLPSELCKFRTFGAEGRDGRDEQGVYELLRGRLRFSTLASFNDPFEGKPYVQNAFDSEPAQRAAVKDYLGRVLLRDRPDLRSSEIRRMVSKQLATLSMEKLRAVLHQSLHETLHSTDSRVFCLAGPSAVATPLPWSHYADSHKGVCIHFRSSFSPFQFAWKITYSDEYPVIVSPRTVRNDSDVLDKGWLQKANWWRYEEEYRLIRVQPTEPIQPGPEGALARMMVPWEGDVAVAPAESVLAVTLGVNMQGDTRTRIRAWIGENAPHIEIWEASLHDRKYEIVRTRVPK